MFVLEYFNRNVVDQMTKVYNNFYYNDEFHILICEICHATVTKSTIKTHLNTSYHSKLSIENKKSLIEKVQTYDIFEFSKLSKPNDYQHCFPFLNIYDDAYSCKTCKNYICLTYKRMKIHLNQIHKLFNVSKKDQNEEKYFQQNLCVQTFSNNIYKHYFKTFYQTRNNDNFKIEKTEIDIEHNEQELKEFQKYKKEKNEINEKENISNTLTFKEYDAFNQDSYFHEYIENKSFNNLIKSVDFETIKSNDHLHLLYITTVENLVKYNSLIAKVDQRSKQIINTDSLKDKQENKNLKPFRELNKNEKSQQYYTMFANLITYIYYSTQIERVNYNQPKFDLFSIEINRLQHDVLNYFNKKNTDIDEQLKNNIFVRVLDLFIELLKHETNQKDFDVHSSFDNPLITFLICKSLNKENRKFQSITMIQQYCTRLIRMSRYANILRAYNEDQKAKNNNFDFDFEKNLIDFDMKYLHNHSRNCFENLCSYRALSRKIVMSLTGNQMITKIDDDTIQCENSIVSISKLKDFFQFILFNLERILYNDLLKTDKNELFSCIDLTKIQDDFHEERNDFYFVNLITKNQNLESMSDFLILKYLKKDSKFSKYFHAYNVVQKNKIETYLNSRIEFLKFFAIFVYLTTGSPLRGEELVTLKYKNTINASLRELFYDTHKRMFMINLKYSKNQNRTRVQSKNIRFISSQASELLLIYLIFVLPFYQYIRIKILDRKTINSCHLFEIDDTNITASTISNFLNLQSNTFMNTSLKLHTNRHIMKYIIRHFIMIENFDDSNSDSDEETSKIEDKLANHSSKTSNMHYARDQNTLMNVAVDSQQQSYIYCLKFFEFFNLIKFNTFSIKRSRTDSNFNISQSNNKRQKLNSSTENELNKKLLLRDINDNITNLDNLLKLFFNDDNAKFKSTEQQLAVEAILNDISCVFYAASTNAGKSLLFLFTSFIESNVLTIVATPLLVLKEDLLRRAKELNIDAQKFEDSTTIQSSLIFISYETLIENNKFDKFIERQRKNNRKIRFVFDEAHYIVMQSNFRYIMKYLSKINEFKIQIVFLSASFTTEIFQSLIQQFDIDMLTNEFKLIKSSSTRNNLKYIVYEMKTNDFFKELSIYLKDHVYKNCDQNDKIIVYINTIKQCEKLAKYLNCLFYHGQMSIEERKSTYNKFSNNSTSNLIIATNALSAGINISSIKYVFHKYDPWMSLIDTDQEDGRAGRNNQNATCVHFVPSKFFKNNVQKTTNRNLKISSIHDIDRQMYLQFLLQKKCMRSILEYYFNNAKIEHCINDQNLCYLCEQRQNVLNVKANAHYTKQSKNEIEKDQLHQKISQYSKICVLCCYNLRFNDMYSHTLADCIYESSIEFQTTKTKLLTSIRNEQLINQGYACFYCYLPQKLCNYSKINDECLFKNCVLDFFVFLIELHLNTIYFNQYQIEIFKKIENLNDSNGFFDRTRIFCQSSTIFSTECVQAINIIQSFDLNNFIENELILSNDTSNSKEIENNKIEMSIENIIEQSQNLQLQKENIHSSNNDDNNSINSFDSLYDVSENEIQTKSNLKSKNISKTLKETRLNKSTNLNENVLNRNENVNTSFENIKNSNTSLFNNESYNNSKNFIDDNNDYDSNLDEETIDILQSRTMKLEFESKLKSKLYFLMKNCAFCYYVDNKKKHLKNHSSTTCDLFQNFSNKIEKFQKSAQKNANDDKRSNKSDLICYECFMPLTICFRIRQSLNRSLNSNKRLNICFVTDEIFCYFYLVFHYQKSLLSLQFTIFTNYDETLLLFERFLSNKYLYYHLEASEATKIVQQIQLIED